MIRFNYDKLETRINEVFISSEAFGQELGLSKRAINSRLKGASEFSLSEIQKAVELLNIPVNQINAYFFDAEVLNVTDIHKKPDYVIDGPGPVIDVNKIPDWEFKQLAKSIVNSTIELFKDPKNQKEYEEWHLQKYGHYPEVTSYKRDEK